MLPGSEVFRAERPRAKRGPGRDEQSGDQLAALDHRVRGVVEVPLVGLAARDNYSNSKSANIKAQFGIFSTVTRTKGDLV